MKKLMLAILAGLMVLSSLKAFAQENAAAPFEIYKDQETTVVLVPVDFAKKIEGISKSQLPSSEKVSLVASLIADLSADTSEESFCAVSVRTYVAHITDENERAKENVAGVKRCHEKLSKERIIKKADGSLLTDEQLNNLKLQKEVTAFERLRIGYSAIIVILML